MSNPQFIKTNPYHEQPLLQSLAITDTSSHFSTGFRADKFSKVDLLINSTLNQTVTVNPLNGLITGGLAYGVEFQDSGTPSSAGISVTAGSSVLVADVPISGQIGVLASCSTAPTSGSITVTAILRG